MRRSGITLTIILLTIVLCGAILSLSILYPVLWMGVRKEMQLVPGSEVYSQWIEPTVPIYLQFFFFNLTNPKEFMAGSKPNVSQVGPFTYRERRSKIVTDYDKPIIFYKEIKQYFFEPNQSVGLDDLNITTANLAFVALASNLDKFPDIVVRIIETVVHWVSDSFITTKTVKQWLWGYEDPLLSFLKKFKIPVNSTVGLFLDKNNTDDGIISMDSGTVRPELIGQIIRYHNNFSLNCWETRTANMINGSDGSLFHLFMNKKDNPYIFSADICRSLQFTFHSFTDIDGLSVIRYIPMDDTFKSPLTYEKNKGFCPKNSSRCGDGILDMSTCLPGSPVVISLPHFLNANHSYLDLVNGLNPTEEFNTSISLEPTTGVVLYAQKKIQINAVIENNPKFSDLKYVQNLYLPLLFLNESVLVDDKVVKSLSNLLLKGPHIATIILSTIIVITIGLLCLVVIYNIRRNRSNYSQTLIDDESSPVA